MQGFVMQSWLTVRGAANATVSQSQGSYLDLDEYDDVVLFLEVREETNSPTLTFQTGMSAEDASFLAIAPAITMATTTTPTVTRVLGGYAPTPLARFLRWQLTGSSAWDATFRITVAAFAAGI
jgi:hypothetical protein